MRGVRVDQKELRGGGWQEHMSVETQLSKWQLFWEHAYVEGVWSERLIKNREVMVGSKGIFVECGCIKQFKAPEFDTLNSRRVECKSVVWKSQWLFCLFFLFGELKFYFGEGLHCFEAAGVDIQHMAEWGEGKVVRVRGFAVQLK